MFLQGLANFDEKTGGKSTLMLVLQVEQLWTAALECSCHDC